MSQDTIKHLFDLNSSGDNCGSEMVIMPKSNIQYIDDDEDDEFVALLLNEVQRNL
jgi:hypothetical protein